MSKIKFNKNNAITCCVYCIIGLLLILLRANFINVIMSVVGGVLIVFGILNIVRKISNMLGVLEIVLGAVIIVCGWTIAQFVLIICGVMLVLISLLYLIKGYKRGFLSYFYPILALVVGTALILSTWLFTSIILVCLGVLFVMYGIAVLFGFKMFKFK